MLFLKRQFQLREVEQIENALDICLERDQIIRFMTWFILCILESNKTFQNNFSRQLNYWLETHPSTPAAKNIKQHLLLSGSQPWQVHAFMVPPGLSVPWLGQTGRARIPPHTPSSHRLKEGTAARRQPRWARGPSSSQCVRISAMSPLEPSEHTSAPNIAQLTSRPQATPSEPSPPLQGSVCEPIIKVRVLLTVTLSFLLKWTLPIWVIICYESEMPITNNKGFRLLVVTPEDVLEAEGRRQVRMFQLQTWTLRKQRRLVWKSHAGSF